MSPRSQRHLLVRGGTLVTMDPARRVFEGEILVSDGIIAAVGERLETPPATRLIDASGCHVLPGFIQAHLHLGQTLFRGQAEGRSLIPWLSERIWPLEAAHTPDSAYWSAMLGASDCLLSGTTTVQDIGLVREMDSVFRAIRDSGIRAVAGKCLMDSGENVTDALLENPEHAISEAEELATRWGGSAGGRIDAAVCPRFVLSCSDVLWERASDLAGRLGLPVHTHLLESHQEENAVVEAHGVGQMEFLDRLGLLDQELRIAHGVLLDDERLGVLGGRRLAVAHCPSANARLGSGIADLVHLTDQPNLAIGIGCDGAACNDSLDILEEMRLAALLQDLKHGPGRFGAEKALALATIDGARAIGKEAELGSLQPGKLGDLAILDLHRPNTLAATGASLYSRIVRGASRDSVRWVVVDGEVLVEHGTMPMLDHAEVLARSREEADALVLRAKLN